MQVTGRDSRGVVFTEETSSENLCRNGAAFVTRFEVTIGSDLDIRIPMSHAAWRRDDPDFATRGRVVRNAYLINFAKIYSIEPPPESSDSK